MLHNDIFLNIMSFLIDNNSCFLDNKNYYLINKQMYNKKMCIIYDGICINHSRSLILQNYLYKKIRSQQESMFNSDDNMLFFHNGSVMDFDVDEVVTLITKMNKKEFTISHRCCSGTGVGILYNL